MRAVTRKSGLIGALAVTLLASACGGGDEGEGEANVPPGEVAGAITVRGCTPENPFIPSNTNEVCGGNPLHNVLAKLVRYDPDTAEPINEIAESIESNDSKTWTIKLKDGWTFHDGTPVQAKNFVDAWNWGAYGPNAQLNSYFFEPIQGYDEVHPADPDGTAGPQQAPPPTADKMSGLKVVDDLTFEVTLSRPKSVFKTMLGYTAFAALPDSFFADNGAAFGKNPIGAGPYKFVSYTENQSIVLTANTDYQGENKPTVKDVTYKVYQDIDAAYTDLLADNLDILDQLPPSALAGGKYQTDLGDRAIEQAEGVIQTVTFPLYDPRFPQDDPKNKELRKAISMAIDRESIVRNVFNDTRIPMTGWVSPVVDGYKEGVCGEACVFDEEKAKAAFASAGGFSGPLTLSYNADGGHKDWVDATCISIKNTLGIDCQPKPYVDLATLRKDVNDRKMDGLIRTGWQMDYPSIENFLTPLYRTGGSSNDSEYSNKAFDDQMNAADQAPPEEANALYQEAEQILATDLPAIPMWYYKTVAGYSNNVAQVDFDPFGRPVMASVTLKSS
jgi:oligopeptide transport system substrate-binding protein